MLLELTADEQALLEYIRAQRAALASVATLGEQFAVVVVNITPKYTFWRGASNLITSEQSRKELGAK